MRIILEVTMVKQLWTILHSLLLYILGLFCIGSSVVMAQTSRELRNDIDRLAQKVEPQVIEWRRDFHQNPELSNREFRTSKVIARYLTQLGMDVQTGIAHTGVVAILQGTQSEPVVALRADMDALPVTEAVDLPFASKARTTYNGKDVGVMHACGHDTHMAILMGVANILAQARDRLPGTVKFIFQPAEEGAPEGEEGGAELMVKQGVLENPSPSAIFGLHAGLTPAPAGVISYKSRGLMASDDALRIIVRGRQTHGAVPWGGVDPIVAAAQIIIGLQNVVSRQVDLTSAPAVVTIGSIHGGVRGNIIPNEVELIGTIRTLDSKMREDVHERIRNTAIKIAESAGAAAEVNIDIGPPVTYNDPELTTQMVPTLQRVVGKQNVRIVSAVTTAEDFSFYQERIPGLYFFLGVTPERQDYTSAPMNHSPFFDVDESALIVGVRALSHLAVDYLSMSLDDK
jgi:amidohydrolase